MLLPLVITELVKAIECLVSLAATVIDKAGMLGGAMHFDMAAAVAGAGEGCGTACVVACKAIGIGVGAGDSCGAGDRSRQVSGGCDIRLGVGACETVHFRSSGGR